ncbi:hypothetical protein AeRB84_021113 [Aphanomyces euteiches]|nr:hypothetical protein AeRB84_021113 [Aphanomyces euteiches]
MKRQEQCVFVEDQAKARKRTSSEDTNQVISISFVITLAPCQSIPTNYLPADFACYEISFSELLRELLRETRKTMIIKSCLDLQTGLSTLQKCTAAIRILSTGSAADTIDDYVRIGESTALKCLKRFALALIDEFGDEYLRDPTKEDIEYYMEINESRGFPGMFGSIDCTHIEWKNFPSAWRGQFQGKSCKATIAMEAVVT